MFFECGDSEGKRERAPSAIACIWLLLVLAMPGVTQAVPAFARQTGQNCVACHAGGQFPELTPYGRLFKLTGYTIGERTIPLSVMGVMSYAKVRDTTKSDDRAADFQKHATPLFATGSVFLAGKATDNIGAFVQVTYDNYAGQALSADGGAGRFQGHSGADNMDFRYADHFIDASRDLIVGLSVNNNPSISDPWNSVPTWMQYTPNASPTSHQFVDGAFPGFGAGGNIAGVTAYGYWNRTLYGEFGFYGSARHALSFMSAGTAYIDKTRLGGTNPYWRLAYSREWGAHNFMVGASGMVAHVFDAGSDTSDPGNRGRFRNLGFDSQYQYLLDPHAVTAQLSFMRQVTNYSQTALNDFVPTYFQADGTLVGPANPSDATNAFRAKLSYVYQAKYGGSVAFFNVHGTSNPLNQSSGFDAAAGGLITTNDPNATGITSTRVTGNLSGNPATRGFNYEGFWTPAQYVRVGVQYTAYNKFNGASSNYDGFGRNPRDNNTLRFYIWAAY
jgi:hypothetical protein